jgi:hypothetical protein
MADDDRYALYRGMAYLTQASLTRLSPNVQALGIAWVGEDPVIGLRLDVDTAADRAALTEIVLEVDGYYDHQVELHTDVAIAPAPLPVREWYFVYLRHEAA